MELWRYEGKPIKLTDVDGDVFVGLADIYSDAEDNAGGVASLTVKIGESNYMEFEEHEIASIEIISEEATLPEAM